MILMSKYKGKHGGKKGQKIRAWVDPPPYIRAMPKRKRFFSIDVFPNTTCMLYIKPSTTVFTGQASYCSPRHQVEECARARGWNLCHCRFRSGSHSHSGGFGGVGLTCFGLWIKDETFCQLGNVLTSVFNEFYSGDGRDKHPTKPEGWHQEIHGS